MRNLRLASMIAAISFGMTTVCAPLVSEAQATVASKITGQIIDRQTNLPIQGATVTLVGGTKAGATTTTDTSGSFSFADLAPGIYSVTIDATGYQASRSTDVAVTAGGTGSVTLAITPAASGGDLKTIGRTTVRGGGADTLQTSSTISRDLDSSLLQRENQIRIADQLNTLPGVTLQGQSSSVGDDIYANIRGLKPSETQLLIDGHPIGPVGVFAGNGGGFNLQDSPSFALRNTQVTFGAGATGLYGVSTVGGTIDLQTIDPSSKPTFSAKYGIGDQGRQLTVFQGTGTYGKLGFALVHGVEGTFGNFQSGPITQQGLTNGDFTTATRNFLTYPVAGNYILHNDLAKLSYDLTKSTKLTLTAVSANSWDDKTGEGDNDFNTYELQLAANQGNVGADPTCPNGIVGMTDGGNKCYSLQQYAALTAGPAGGGLGAWQAINSQDYHARLTQQLGVSNTLVLDSFVDNYFVLYHRDAIAATDAAGNPNPLAQNTNQTRNVYKTYGNLISDDFIAGNNDLGIGYYQQTQKKLLETTVAGANAPIPQVNAQFPNGGIALSPLLYSNQQSFFLRDNYRFSSQFSAYFNAWAEHSDVTKATYFEPRLSLVFRPSANDVFRLTGGQSDGIPAAETVNGKTNLVAVSNNLNCGSASTYSIGSSANSNLLAEKANDIEVAYGHRFVGDTSINIDIYNTNEQNQIFSGAAPASTVQNQLSQQFINAYLAKIAGVCGSRLPNPSIANLVVTTNFNAAGAKSQGIEISGRLRASNRIYFDASYDVSSSVRNGVNAAILARNSSITNGGQIVSLPLQKASLSLDASDGHGGDFRIDEYYIGNNNDLVRPAYTYANLSYSKTLFRGTTLNFGVSNAFNNAVDTYGRIGYGTVPLLNPNFAANPNYNNTLNAGYERFGLPPRSFIFTIEQRTN